MGNHLLPRRRTAILKGVALLSPLLVQGSLRPAWAKLDKDIDYTLQCQKLVEKLRESVNIVAKDEIEFRRDAQEAKDEVKEFIDKTRDNAGVKEYQSYKEITNTLKALGKFYNDNDSMTPLTKEIKATVNDLLDKAEEALGPKLQEPSILDRLADKFEDVKLPELPFLQRQ